MSAPTTPAAPTELQIYRVPLPDDTRQLVMCLRQLSPPEHEQAGRQRSERAYRRYVMTKARLREIIGRYLDMAPRAVPIVYDSRGKPSLDPRTGDGVRFSCAHAGDLALVALSTVELGVDIEPLRQLDDPLDLARACCTGDELATLGQLDPAAQSAALLRCFTRKSATLKALGADMAAGMRHFEIALDRERQQLGVPDLRQLEQPTALEVLRQRTAVMTLLQIQPAPGYTAAAAICAEQIALRWQNWAS